MSFDTYRKAMQLVETCEDLEMGEGVSREYLEYVEERLDITLSPIHRDFLQNYGYLCFCGYEIFGIAEDTPEDAPAWGNMLLTALLERREQQLEHNLLPVMGCDDGAMVYLRYGESSQEPDLIAAVCDGNQYIVTNDNYANDFGDFLFSLVSDSIE